MNLEVCFIQLKIMFRNWGLFICFFMLKFFFITLPFWITAWLNIHWRTPGTHAFISRMIQSGPQTDSIFVCRLFPHVLTVTILFQFSFYVCILSAGYGIICWPKIIPDGACYIIHSAVCWCEFSCTWNNCIRFSSGNFQTSVYCHFWPVMLYKK